MPLYFDKTIIIIIPAIILSMYAQSKIQSSYSKYSRIRTQKGFTGAEVARMILNSNGLTNINIEHIGGVLTDHYDPRSKVLRLSSDVYNGTSIAANAIAAHEVGHAIQHARVYLPLKIRNAIVPVVNIASQAAMPLILLGLFFSSFSGLLNIGIYLFSATVIFQIITLPVEFDASIRAIKSIENERILIGNEVDGGKNVLTAAALTYIAGATSAILQLLRLIMVRNSRRD